MDSKAYTQMDVAVDLIDRYHAATHRRLYVTDKLTSIMLGNDESQWLFDFEKEVIRQEDELKKMVE